MINGINFFKGENNVGKTTFIWELSYLLNQLGYTLCFIGGTRDLENNHRFLRIFDYDFFNVHDDRIFQLILEIKNRVDYLVIDDIDFIDTNYIDLIFKYFNKPIIITCDINRVYSNLNHLNFILHKNKNIELQDGTFVKTEQFLNQIKRENKIEKILNDKS